MDSFRYISEKFGSNTLFEIGKAIPGNARYPNKVGSIEQVFGMLDVAYKMNHRNGDIGFYKLVSHDRVKKKIEIQCQNPYPCDFDRGLITALGRKFSPSVNVELNTEKPSRKDGADDSWYIVSY